jgi:hypothetical protein
MTTKAITFALTIVVSMLTNCFRPQPPQSIQTADESQALRTNINGPTRLAFDSDGFLFILEFDERRLLRLDVKHASIKVVLPKPEDNRQQNSDFPEAIALDQRGSLFIGDFNGRLRKLDILFRPFCASDRSSPFKLPLTGPASR